jgi:hypothetical protein
MMEVVLTWPRLRMPRYRCANPIGVCLYQAASCDVGQNGCKVHASATKAQRRGVAVKYFI